MELDARGPLRDQLSLDEHLLWSGKPSAGLRLRASDAFLIPFSLMWGGFAIFWEWTVPSQQAPLLFKLWGIPFVLVGFHMMVGRFFFDAHQRANTYYGVSNQRVLIVTTALGGRVKSLNLRTLTDLTLSGSATGTGSIQFGSAPWATASWPSRSGSQAVPAFEFIEDAKRVYDIIRQAQQKAA